MARPDAHHLGRVLDQAATARMMIVARRRCSPKTIAKFRNERLSERAQARVGHCLHSLHDELPVVSLFCPQFGRPLEEFVSLLFGQRPHRPFVRFQAKLRVLLEVALELDEVSAGETRCTPCRRDDLPRRAASCDRRRPPGSARNIVCLRG